MRVLVISDLHCGHLVGLTHPDFDAVPATGGKREALYRLRRTCWRQFQKWIEELQPIDRLIVNGDMVEGKAAWSGGTELLTSDRVEQVDMATAAIQAVGCPDIRMAYGTSAHTGKDEDWEDLVARVLGAPIVGQGHAEIGGVVFDYRHHLGRSSVPYGRATPLAKERVWGALKAIRKEAPTADVIVRSHNHYAIAVVEPDWLAVSTPALCAYTPGSKLGERRMSGTVDFGLTVFDVADGQLGGWEWKVLRFTKRATPQAW